MLRFGLAFVLLSSSLVFAQQVTEDPTQNSQEREIEERDVLELSGRSRTRFSGRGERVSSGVLQENITLVFRVNPWGPLSLVSVIETGDGFTDTWLDIAAFDGAERDEGVDISWRRLYVEGHIDDTLIQFGSLFRTPIMGPVQGFTSGGWIDGLRVMYERKDQDLAFSVTGGRLGTTEDSANIHERDFTPNYLDVRVSKKLFEMLAVEGSIEIHEDHFYIGAAGEVNIQLTANRILDFVAETLVEADTGNFMASGGIETDVWALLTGEKSGVKLSARFVHVSAGMDNRWDLVSGIFRSRGNFGVLGLDIPFLDNDDHKVNVFFQYRPHEDPREQRMDIGLIWRFQ